MIDHGIELNINLARKFDGEIPMKDGEPLGISDPKQHNGWPVHAERLQVLCHRCNLVLKISFWPDGRDRPRPTACIGAPHCEACRCYEEKVTDA